MQLNINSSDTGLLLWSRSCPKPTHASTNSLEELEQMSKILHCTLFKAKKFAVESDVNLRQHGLNVLHVFKKVLKSSMSYNATCHVKHTTTTTTTTTNKIECTLSQPINKNTTGIHTYLCISMYAACAQTWSRKMYLNPPTLTNLISLGPNSQNIKLKLKTKKCSGFAFLQQFHLAQCDPTQFEGRMVAVCSLQF